MQVVEVKEMPNVLNLTEWSMQDFNSVSRTARDMLLRKSDASWAFMEGNRTLMVVGIYRAAFVGNEPELWLVLCKEFSENLRRNLLWVRDKMEELLERYPRVRVKIDAEYPVGSKFARFMGFEKLELPAQMIGDREYLVYEVTR